MANRPVPSFLVFRDGNGHWRWNFAARNGRIVAASSVGYAHQKGCVQAIRLMKGEGQADIPVLVRRARPPAAAGEGPVVGKAKVGPQTNDNQPDATLNLETEQILR